MIELDNLVKEYNRENPEGKVITNRAVDGFSFSVKDGEVFGLLGPNGAGKTTTFYMIVGLEKPTAGRVYLSKVNISQLPMYKRAQLGISYLAQEASIFRKLTVVENIMSILENIPMTQEARIKKVKDLLEEFHVSHVMHRKGSELSGGERRRVEIARCLALEPQFILLDEPFAGVDPLAVADIQNIIRYLRERGMGVLITDHNVRETLRIVDRAYILNDGKILVEGTSDFIANSEIAKKYYLGDNFEL